MGVNCGPPHPRAAGAAGIRPLRPRSRRPGDPRWPPTAPSRVQQKGFQRPPRGGGGQAARSAGCPAMHPPLHRGQRPGPRRRATRIGIRLSIAAQSRLRRVFILSQARALARWAIPLESNQPPRGGFTSRSRSSRAGLFPVALLLVATGKISVPRSWGAGRELEATVLMDSKTLMTAASAVAKRSSARVTASMAIMAR